MNSCFERSRPLEVARSTSWQRFTWLGAFVPVLGCAPEQPERHSPLELAIDSPVAVIGVEEGSPTETFGVVSDVDVRNDGVYLLDGQAARLYKFSHQGRLITQAGGQIGRAHV